MADLWPVLPGKHTQVRCGEELHGGWRGHQSVKPCRHDPSGISLFPSRLFFTPLYRLSLQLAHNDYEQPETELRPPKEPNPRRRSASSLSAVYLQGLPGNAPNCRCGLESVKKFIFRISRLYGCKRPNPTIRSNLAPYSHTVTVSVCQYALSRRDPMSASRHAEGVLRAPVRICPMSAAGPPG